MVVRAADELDDTPPVAGESATPPEPSVDGSAVAAIVRGRLFDDAEPYRIGRFAVVERIASGGMGVVYAGFDAELDRRVAIKLLFPGSAGEVEHRRLVREAQAMAKLADPNVAHVYEVGTHHGRTFVAMEHVRGDTVRAWLSARDRDWREILDVMVQAGRGLAAAHAAGVVHRDLKPDNLLVGDDGRVRVVDFGLARITDADEEPPAGDDGTAQDPLRTRTRAGAVVGTPAYMAPEQIDGAPAGPAADQFAWCVSCWEAFTGMRPFGGTSLRELRDAVARGRITAQRSGAMPRWIEAVLRRGLAVDPQARHPSMQALLQALARDPSARRRRALLAAGVVVAGLGAWGWQALAQRSRARACADEGGAIAEAWTPELGDRLAAGFAATGRDDAPAAFTRTRARIDAFAESWSRTRSDVCLADDTREPEQSQQARACLDVQRAQLAALTEQLARVDPSLIQRAVTAAAALPSPAACVDPRSLLRRAQLVEPLTPEARAELARITALRTTARYDEAFAAATTLAERTTTVHPELEHELGLVEDARGHYAEARSAHERAFYGAGELGDDPTALRAATALVSVVGFRQAETDAGLEWYRMAKMFVARLELEDDPGIATLEHHLGQVYDTAGRHEDALAAHRRALEMRERVLGDAHPETAGSWFNIGVMLGELARFDEAIAAYDRGLAIDEVALGPAHPSLASTLNSKGMVLGERGDIAEGRAVLERALAIKRAALGEQHPSFGNTLHALANLAARDGDFEGALAGYVRAHAVFEPALGSDHPSTLMALAARGTLLGDLRRYEESQRVLEQALALQERRLGPDHLDLVATLANLARTVWDRGDPVAALALLERADRITVAELGADFPPRATQLTLMGQIAAELGDRERGLQQLELALELHERAGAAPEELAHTQWALARVEWEDPARRAHARTLAQTARETRSRLGPGHADAVAEIDGWLASH